VTTRLPQNYRIASCFIIIASMLLQYSNLTEIVKLDQINIKINYVNIIRKVEPQNRMFPHITLIQF